MSRAYTAGTAAWPCGVADHPITRSGGGFHYFWLGFLAGAFFATALAGVFWAGVFARLGVLAVVFFAAGVRAPGVAAVAFCAAVFLATAGLMEVRVAADRLPAAAFVAPPFLGACQPMAFAERPLTARVWLATLPSASFTLSMRRCLAITLLGPDRSSPTACASTSSAGDRLAEKTG